MGRRSQRRPRPDPSSRTATRGDALPTADAPHVPVMLREVLAQLAPRDGETFIDATFGAGGYTRAILSAADVRVTALDRDPSAIAAGSGLVTATAAPTDAGPRLTLVASPFSQLEVWADEGGGPGAVDGIVFDLGVSSMQIDRPDRGFSFQSDGPLDMRMFASPGLAATEARPSAGELVARLEEDALADVLFHYGDERRSRAIARAIVKERANAPITTTQALADLVVRVIGRRPGDPIHPATRTFQALRIAVNDELGELVRGLAGAERLLKQGGRLVVVTFHSLEDRIVKRFLAERSGRAAQASRHLPVALMAAPGPERDGSFRILNPRPLLPQDDEVAANPRARSAKLRAGVRTAAPAMPVDAQALGLPPGLG